MKTVKKPAAPAASEAQPVRASEIAGLKNQTTIERLETLRSLTRRQSEEWGFSPQEEQDLFTLLRSYVPPAASKDSREAAAEATARLPEEERSLCEQLERYLVARNFGLVLDLAASFARCNPKSYDDYLSSGSLGLMKAVRAYDLEYSYSHAGAGQAKFGTFATHLIRNEIIHDARVLQRQRRAQVYESDVGGDYLADASVGRPQSILEDLVAMDEELRRITHPLLNRDYPNMTLRQRLILKLRYAYGMKNPEIGALFPSESARGHLSKQRVKQIIDDGLQKVAKNLESGGPTVMEGNPDALLLIHYGVQPEEAEKMGLLKIPEKELANRLHDKEITRENIRSRAAEILKEWDKPA